MFLLAFHAFLRVGEITQDNPSQSNVINLDQVSLPTSDNSVVIDFCHFKHSNGRSFRLTIRCQPDPAFCPVVALSEYLSVRGGSPGPLFLCSPTTPVSRNQFNTSLNQSLAYNGLDLSKYKSHSFRIGSATEAAASGHSDSQIRQMGRWKSDAFKNYIRTSQQNSSF
jgi:hypothetical protein